MSNQDAEDLSQDLADFLSHRLRRQFALALEQRRILNQQQLQFAKALQTKHLADEKTESSTATVRGFVQTIGARGWMPKRSFQDNPLKFARAKPLELTYQSLELASTDAAAPNVSLDLSPEVAKAKSLDPAIRYSSKSLTGVTHSNSLNSPIVSSNKSINEIKELELKVNQSNFQILESSVQGFLSRILNIRVPGVRVYANTLSDSLVQKYHADALTYPDKILFRIGKYDPRKMMELALLGHEVTHLEQFRRQDMLSTSENSAIAETEALANERKVFRYISAQQGYPEHTKSVGFNPDVDSFMDSSLRTPQPPIPQVRDIAQSSPMPKAALSERDIGLPPFTPQLTNSVAPPSELQLKLIKDEVYQDLRQCLRTEFERGS
ncbi:DUF4157 domain-containing protein [Nostoc sp. UIC 10607]|uniref:eCIS core domain-containing protein n=1 Tax=Nostoc sp. UIC 10607 TaxID=3045935 RepID=UPI0039A2E7F3